MMQFIYTGRVFRNCGPTGDQKSALAADQAFGAALRNSYGTDFAEAQEIFKNLNGNLEEIIAKGPSQTGMSASELAARNSQAINNAAGANKHIQAAIGERADAGGATPGVESGITEAIRSKAMTDVENNLSNTEANITEKNYELGREQYNTAVKEDMALPAATMNPVSNAAGGVNDANKLTADEANYNAKIPTWKSSLLGMAGGIASGAAAALSGGVSRMVGGLFPKGHSGGVSKEDDGSGA